MKTTGNNILVSMGISGIAVLMAKFIGDIPLVMQTTKHHSLISSTVPDLHTSPNRAPDQHNRALDQHNKAPDQLNKAPDQLNKAPDQLNRVPGPLDNRASEEHLNQLDNGASEKPLNQLNNRASEKPLNQLDNRASEEPLNQLNNQPTNTASTQAYKRPAEQAYSNKRIKVLPLNKTFAYWHRSSGHSSKIDHKLYDDGYLLPSIPADFT